jgi:peroxiredoxin
MPALNKLVDHYNSAEVEFLSLTHNKPQLVMQFLNKHDFKFKIVPDNLKVMKEKFKLYSIWPYSIIIDKGENK